MMDKYLSILSVIAQDVLPVGHAKIAACIVYKGSIISIGRCSYKTHPLQARYGRSVHAIHIHAEVDALVKAQKRVLKRGIPLEKCTMYVARVKRPFASASYFVTGLAKPCEGCMRAIQAAGITNIRYTEG
jgi:deoxycytidylate deaminase